jgi:hypothetical protein
MTRILTGIVIGALFIAALFFATRSHTGVECELCVEFRGRTACRTAGAADRDEAIRAAVTTACAVLASGVTDGIQCDRTPPHSVRCTE